MFSVHKEMQGFRSISFRHVNRSANQIAHTIAKTSLKTEEMVYLVDCAPSYDHWQTDMERPREPDWNEHVLGEGRKGEGEGEGTEGEERKGLKLCICFSSRITGGSKLKWCQTGVWLFNSFQEFSVAGPTLYLSLLSFNALADLLFELKKKDCYVW